MKVEKQITPLKAELETLVNKYKEPMIEFQGKIQKLIEEVSKFDGNWIGKWGYSDFSHYRNWPDSGMNGVSFTITSDGIIEYAEGITEVTFDELEKLILPILKANRDFKEKVVTELSFIKGMENLQPEIDLLNKIETQEWGITLMDYVKMKRPSKIMTNDPASILNKGLDTPPHFFVGGKLMSLFSFFTAIEDFGKNVKRLIRQLEIKFSMEESDSVDSVFLIKIVNRFHSVVRQIQNRHSKRPTINITDEYDVQDLFHGLLQIEFEDIRAEEHTPSYAGSATRMDFLLKKEKIVIEVKKTREGLKDKEIGDQLIIDFQHYKTHPDCKRLICFVYDPENKVKNPRGLEADLNSMSNEDLIVEVYIRP